MFCQGLKTGGLTDVKNILGAQYVIRAIHKCRHSKYTSEAIQMKKTIIVLSVTKLSQIHLT